MQQRLALGISILSVFGALALAPAANAQEGKVTLLKGSTLGVTYPDGTSHVQPMRGRFLGTLPAPALNTEVRMALYYSTASAIFLPRTPLCHGGTNDVRYKYTFVLAQVEAGAPPSTMLFGNDGRVTLSWTVPLGVRTFTGCRSPIIDQPATGDQTLTLTGKAGRRGLNRLVLRGGANDIPVEDNGRASFSVRLVTRVDFS